MTDLQPILDLIAGQWPWLSKVLIAMGGARLVLKPLGQWVKQFITAAAEQASLTIDPEDDTWIEALLRARAYRVFAFLLDLFVSVKLPAAVDLFAVKPTPP